MTGAEVDLCLRSDRLPSTNSSFSFHAVGRDSLETPINQILPVTVPQDQQERVELANQLFREFHTRCFWHSPRDLVITEELIPFVIKGLRTHGGHRGFRLAAIRQAKEATPRASE
jgi:hypothetical protein